MCKKKWIWKTKFIKNNIIKVNIILPVRILIIPSYDILKKNQNNNSGIINYF